MCCHFQADATLDVQIVAVGSIYERRRLLQGVPDDSLLRRLSALDVTSVVTMKVTMFGGTGYSVPKEMGY